MSLHSCILATSIGSDISTNTNTNTNCRSRENQRIKGQVGGGPISIQRLSSFIQLMPCLHAQGESRRKYPVPTMACVEIRRWRSSHLYHKLACTYLP
jgi:hypothetical protein